MIANVKTNKIQPDKELPDQPSTSVDSLLQQWTVSRPN